MAHSNNPLTDTLLPYVEQNAESLLTRVMLGGESRKLFNLMTGVKGLGATLNIMDVDPQLQELSCGWSESGSTVMSQRQVVPANLQSMMAFCTPKLLNSWAAHQISIGAGKENLPFEEKWVGSIIDKLNEKIESLCYFGDSQSGTVKNQFDGLVTIANADPNVIKVEATSAATVSSFIKDIVKAIPAKVKDAVLLISTPMYRNWCLELVEANLFHYSVGDGKEPEGYFVPGTNVKVIPVNGLNSAPDGKEYAFCTRLSNVYWAVSADTDTDSFDLFFEPSEREFRMIVAFAAAVQYAFSDEVVLGIKG